MKLKQLFCRHNYKKEICWVHPIIGYRNIGKIVIEYKHCTKCGKIIDEDVRKTTEEEKEEYRLIKQAMAEEFKKSVEEFDE